MCYFIPIYPQRSVCVACGCKIGTKAIGQIKKATSIGLQKAVDLWINKKIVINYTEHKMCKNCFLNDEVVTQSSNEIDFKYLVDLLSLFIKSKTKNKTKIENDDNQEQSLLCLKLREEQCIEACGLSVGNLEDLSNNIHQNTQIIFEFLNICRQGLSQHFAAILANKSQSSISQNIGSVLENLSHLFQIG